MDEKEFLDRVTKIQNELNAPKGNYNSYGNFSYRSVEDITQAVKPLLKKHGLFMRLTDEIISIDGRFYVKATAEIIGVKGEDDFYTLKSNGYARESDSKKGMDNAQLTGACSSYARKYALGGLLLIDDNKGFDMLDNEETGNENKDLTYEQKLAMTKKEIKKVSEKTGRSTGEIHKYAIRKINEKYGENLEAPTEEHIQEYLKYVMSFPYQNDNNNQNGKVDWGN